MTHLYESFCWTFLSRMKIMEVSNRTIIRKWYGILLIRFRPHSLPQKWNLDKVPCGIWPKFIRLLTAVYSWSSLGNHNWASSLVSSTFFLGRANFNSPGLQTLTPTGTEQFKEISLNITNNLNHLLNNQKYYQRIMPIFIKPWVFSIFTFHT